MYKPRKKSVHRTLQVRDLQYRVHCWGNPAGTPVLLLHGWADTGMSFQFLADAMDDAWYLIAPDWRGFGDSGWQPGGYWFPDYLADLEVLLDTFCAQRSARLAGHSMGGNVAWLYAGIRPERVSHAVSIDVYGLPDSTAVEAPARYAQWLDQLQHQSGFSAYADIGAVAGRIRRLAPQLDRDRATFLAGHWSYQGEEGQYHLKHDPAHKRVNPVLYRRAEARACWRNIQADVLLIMAAESAFYKKYLQRGYRAEFTECISTFSESVINDCGHMIHLEQPQRLAAVLEDFFSS